MRILDKHANYQGGKTTGDGSNELVGFEIGKFSFAEHEDSITARKEGLKKGDATVVAYYAVWGCGTNSRHDKRVMTSEELQKIFGPGKPTGRI